MSIRDIEVWRSMQKLNLTREQIAKRAIEIMRLSQKDAQYQGTMQAVGRLITLAKCCDSYWTGKVNQGKHKEECDLEDIAAGRKPEYFGYGGIVSPEQGEEK